MMLAYRADDETRTRDPHLGKVMRYQLRYIRTVRDTGIEPVTSSVSGKRSPAELNAPRADDETRTRDPHLGKVMRYQLRYIRTRHFRGARKNISRSHPTNTNLHVSNRITYSCPTVFPATAHHLQPGAPPHQSTQGKSAGLPPH